MPKYICNDKNCAQQGVEVSITKTRITISPDGDVHDTAAKCPVCGKIRKTVKSDGYTTMFHSNNVPI